MKEETKEFMKKNLIGFILGIISACTISVIAATYFPSNDVTYDNSESGLKSTNVQGAIDELYGVCFPPKAGDQIIEDAGLEKDLYEDRYFYKGANPNNYIMFSNDLWRIISVEGDGTIKIIRNNDIGNMSWDKTGGQYGSNVWTRPADLNTYLNNNYLNTLSEKEKIDNHNWNIGMIDTNSSETLSTLIEQENRTKWLGELAVISMSEYLRTNDNVSQCSTIKSLISHYSVCNNTNWLFNSKSSFTMDAINTGNLIYVILDFGRPNSMTYPIATNVPIRPVLYLSSDVKITGGDGSQNNPYTLE